MDYPLRLVSQLRAHLQALRKLRGVTQAELGRRLGLSQVRIAEIEANPGVVSVDQLASILSALNALLVLRDLADNPVAAKSAPAPARGPRRTGVAATAKLKPKKGSW